MSLFNTRQGPRSDAKEVAKSAAARMERLKAIRSNMGDAKLAPRSREAVEAEAAENNGVAAPLTSPRRADGTEASWDREEEPAGLLPEKDAAENAAANDETPVAEPLVLSGAEMVRVDEPEEAIGIGPEPVENAADWAEDEPLAAGNAAAWADEPVVLEAAEVEADLVIESEEDVPASALADEDPDFEDDYDAGYEDETDAFGLTGAADAAFAAFEDEAEYDAFEEPEPVPGSADATDGDVDVALAAAGDDADVDVPEEAHADGALVAESLVEDDEDGPYGANATLGAVPEEVEDLAAPVEDEVLARLHARFKSVRRPPVAEEPATAAAPAPAEPPPPAAPPTQAARSHGAEDFAMPGLAPEFAEDVPPPPTTPTVGRGRRGRNTTRLLGFDHAIGSKTDLFDAPQDETPAQEEAEDGGTVSRFPVGWLVVIDGPGLGHAFTLYGGLSLIGRGEGQRIRLDFGDTAISRENHAAVAYDDEDHSLTLAQSGKANLVRLNGKPVLSNETLEDGDIIKIGTTKLRVVQLCNSAFNWKGVREGNGA